MKTKSISKKIALCLSLTVLCLSLIATKEMFAQSERRDLLDISIDCKLPKTVIKSNEDVHIEEFSLLNEHRRVIEPQGDIWAGFTRMIPFRRMIPPYGLEVTVEKTVHIIFPAPIIYVDLGNENIIAAVVGEATNVLRVKSAVEGFETETNLAVITNNGSFYSFNVKYAKEPQRLNIEMQDFLSDGDAFNRPNNAMEIYLKELQNESPLLVNLIQRAIYANNNRFIRHIGSRMFGIQYTLKGIYSHGGLLYFHVEIRNATNVNFDVDYFNFTMEDKKLAKRTTVQEIVLRPVRAYNYVTSINARKVENIVLTFPIFTVPPDKVVKFNLNEKGGGRHQSFTIDGDDLMRAREIKEFHIR